MEPSEADPAINSPIANDGSNGFAENARPRDSRGWDGRARVERRAVITNPEALSDPEYSDEDAPPIQQISADEGGCTLKHALSRPC